MSCAFCSISKNELESYAIYEDENTKAFLDIRPINKGHILVIPKEHVTSLQEISDDLYAKLMSTVKQMSALVDERIKPVKVGITIAGFDIDHLHVHVIPMNKYHDITSQKYLDGSIQEAKDDTLAEVKNRLTVS
ncbi:HIT family protein [Shouchella shacheensis]|uniref:HIT family protein n=1 Tax=Shouchella shacheensis TaxID=1649580 RepID=UPI00073FBF9E|nr:HIT domain-containing protein [Shouchella shacheensis]